MNSIIDVQPRVYTSASGKSSDDIVTELCTSIENELPGKIDTSTGHPDLFVKGENGLIPSLSTVLLHEVERYNTLLRVIARNLADTKKAILGELLMSDELD